MTIKLHIACIVHRHGAEFFVEEDRDQLMRSIAEWCRSYWTSDGPDCEPPRRDAEAVQRYFDHVEGEACHFSPEPVPVELAIVPTAVAAG